MRAPLVLDALGTRWWISSSDTLPEERIRSIILIFQKRYSRFNPFSDLGRLNDTKRFKDPSDEFLALLRYGIGLFADTGGLFNMSVGAYLEQEGYGPSSDPNSRVSTDLTKDVAVRPSMVEMAPHVRLDLGGFGKGWLIDDIGRLLRSEGITEFIINGGGDILVGETVQPLLIEHPLHYDEQIGTVSVRNGALASSSRQKRAWKGPDGATRNHIVGAAATSADLPVSVHVSADTALEADTFATVFLLTDSLQRPRLAKTRHLEYLEIDHDLQFKQTSQFRFQPNP